MTLLYPSPTLYPGPALYPGDQSQGIARDLIVTATLMPGTPREIHTSLGGREYVGLALSTNVDISNDAVQITLGTWTTPGTWRDPTLDDGGSLVRTVGLLVGVDITPTAGKYYVWFRLPDSPEVIVGRYDHNTILVD